MASHETHIGHTVPFPKTVRTPEDVEALNFSTGLLDGEGFIAENSFILKFERQYSPTSIRTVVSITKDVQDLLEWKTDKKFFRLGQFNRRGPLRFRTYSFYLNASESATVNVAGRVFDVMPILVFGENDEYWQGLKIDSATQFSFERFDQGTDMVKMQYKLAQRLNEAVRTHP